MQKRTANLIFIFLVCSMFLSAQATEIDRLVDSEFKMTFPSIYFKNNSTEYSAMPYTVDSCFKYIAKNKKNLNSYPMWRDSSETDELTKKRIKKIRVDLNKFTPSGKINFDNMGEVQKVSRYTIDKSLSAEQIQYLLSLNSVLDISGTIVLTERKWWQRRTHLEGRYLCIRCWTRGAFSKQYQRLHGRKSKKKKNNIDKK